MNAQKQVHRSHYTFRPYMDKGRWTSVWYQLDAVLALEPDRVLEIGPGPGVLRSVAACFDLRVETLDLDPELGPEHVGSATSLPFANAAFDVVCAFQMLEHLPYPQAKAALAEMGRVARKGVVISLPDVRPMWRWWLHVPTRGMVRLMVPRPAWRPPAHVFDGEHHWEINKKDYELARVQSDFASILPLVRTERLFEEPYYRFFVFGSTCWK